MSYKINGTIVIDNSRNVCACCVTACCITGTTKVSVPYGTTANRPAAGAGVLYYDTDEGSLVVNDGTDWAAAAGAQTAVGGIESISPITDTKCEFGFVQLQVVENTCCCCPSECINCAFRCAAYGTFPEALLPSAFSAAINNYVCDTYYGTGLACNFSWNQTNFTLCADTGKCVVPSSTCAMYNMQPNYCNSLPWPTLGVYASYNMAPKPHCVLMNLAAYSDGSVFYSKNIPCRCGSLKFCQTCTGCPTSYVSGVYVTDLGEPILHNGGGRINSCVCSGANLIVNGTGDEWQTIVHPGGSYKGPIAKTNTGNPCAYFTGDSPIANTTCFCNFTMVVCTGTRGQNSFTVCSDAVPHNLICNCGSQFMSCSPYGTGISYCNAHCTRWHIVGDYSTCYNSSCGMILGLMPLDPAVQMVNHDSYTTCISGVGTSSACVMAHPPINATGTNYALYRNRMGAYGTCSNTSCCWGAPFNDCSTITFWDHTCRYMHMLFAGCGGCNSFWFDCNCLCCITKFTYDGTTINCCICCGIHGQCWNTNIRVYDTCTATQIAIGQYRGWCRNCALIPAACYVGCWNTGQNFALHNMCRGEYCRQLGMHNASCNSINSGANSDRFRSSGIRAKKNAYNVISSCDCIHAYIYSHHTSCPNSTFSQGDQIQVYNFNTCLIECVLQMNLGCIIGGCINVSWYGQYAQSGACPFNNQNCHIVCYLQDLTGCTNWSCCCCNVFKSALFRCFVPSIPMLGWMPANYMNCASCSRLRFYAWPSETCQNCTLQVSKQFYINPFTNHVVMPVTLQDGSGSWSQNSCCETGSIRWMGVICYDLTNRCISKVNAIWNGPTMRNFTTVCGGLGTHLDTNCASGCQRNVSYPRAGWNFTGNCCTCSCEAMAMRMIPYQGGDLCEACSGAVFMVTPHVSTCPLCAFSCQFGGMVCCLNCTCPLFCYPAAVCNHYHPVCQCWEYKMGYGLQHYKVPYNKPLECVGFELDPDMKCMMEWLQGCHAFGRVLKCGWIDCTDINRPLINCQSCYCSACNDHLHSTSAWRWGYCCICCALCGIQANTWCAQIVCDVPNICGCGQGLCGSTPAQHNFLCFVTSCISLCYHCIMRNIGNDMFGGSADHAGSSTNGQSKAQCSLQCLNVCDHRTFQHATCGIKSIGGYTSAACSAFDIATCKYKEHYCTVAYPCQCCHS